MPSTVTFESAVDHHQSGRLSEAEKEYLELLNFDGSNIDALRLLAALYVQTKRPKQAIDFFERALSVQPQDPEILNNLGVALHDAGRHSDAITRYEEAVAVNNFPPAKQNLARASYDRGNALLAEGYDGEAGIWYERAIHLDPQHFRAMNNLAGLRRRQGRLDEAKALYEKALKLKPDYIEARINLGNAWRDAGDANAAAACYRQVLNAKPNSADALHNMGVLYQDSGEIKKAIAHYGEALKYNPTSDVIKSTKGFAHLALGDFEQGWALNEGLGNKYLRGPMLFPSPLWDGRDFAGKRLLIWCEQGLGDNIQFIRYAELCKQRGGTVKVLVPPHLARLFKSMPGVDEVLQQAVPDDFDFHVPMMSLPYIFKTRLETIPAKIPYIFVDQNSREKWGAKIPKSSDRKIGLVWGGSSRETITDAWLLDRRRSISLELLKPLLDIPGTSFYSLQLGKPAAQIDEFGLRERIVDLTKDIEDFLDTAALIENLDLVITVDTSVAHLAGALGKPVWILSRFDACWRWLQNRETSPWYPTARIFGQPKARDWGSVVEGVRELLSNL